jgi:Zn-dependent peptidase ImmA (M78 family)
MATTSNPANRVPYIGKEELIRKADEFLKKYNLKNEIPVPIEDIVEITLGMKVLYPDGLKKAIGADSYLCIDPTIIVIDSSQINCIERLRFTYAHELSHFILHKDVYDLRKVNDEDSYKEFQNSITGDEIKRLESQAYYLAGYLLMPKDVFRRNVDNIIKNEGGISLLSVSAIQRLVESVSTDFFVSGECARKQFEKEYPEIIQRVKDIA